MIEKDSNALLHVLNAPQREVVTAPLGHFLVLAGAGSGKTRVLVHRIAWLIDVLGLQPHHILAVTFTNKAANEIKRRLEAMISTSLTGLWVGTFHGLCHRLLRRHYVEAGLLQNFHILDSEDQARLLKQVIVDLDLNIEQYPVKGVQSFINKQKDQGHRADQVPIPLSEKTQLTKTLVSIYRAYDQACMTAGVMDFSELLLRAYELLKHHPELLEHYRQRFQALLVDEFQDINSIQYAWIALLAGSSGTVLAVGDDDQSIYGWRGANVEYIGQFTRDFKGATIVRLEQNYRSTSTIIQAAHALITHNVSRMEKQLWTEQCWGEKILLYRAFNEQDEARFVCDFIRSGLKKGKKADDFAVLYRSNAQSRVLEETLWRLGISYRIYGGLRYFDRAEIKDALAYLRLTLNPDDDSAFTRIINVPPRGLGDKTIAQVRAHAHEEGTSLWVAAQNLIQSSALSGRARSALAQFVQLIERLQAETDHLDLDEQIDQVIHSSGLYHYFSSMKGDNSESRLKNLEELISAAKQFYYEQDGEHPLPSNQAFLAHAALDLGAMEGEQGQGSVHLMTMHAAKGLEFPTVFLVGMEEELLPGMQRAYHPARLEEERRLCYVGMTRAMQQLVLTYAVIRQQYGKRESHSPSRFIHELPQDLVEMA